MSASDPDNSESSNLGSPFSQSDSPYSSPSQQVPQLANFLTVLSCADPTARSNNGDNAPYLRIIEQPQNHFRFRYRSEMIGTHGCLLGKSCASNKTKSHPTVELMNYTGQARIRCRLAQHNNRDEHPHKLLEDDQVGDVSTQVPEHGSYKVGFPGMGIIHTAKKDVPQLLFQKFETVLRSNPLKSFDERELRSHCENVAKNINLNIVRLKFSAHDVLTDKEICPPVFSEPIHNMKSAATNDLKICRMSRCYGRPKGGDDVFILVEKVNKKNIKIRFYELTETGEECWSAYAHFIQNDVHHQYAIVFRTPAYDNPKITSNVKVFVELLRPSDGRTSEPEEFTYKAESVNIMRKKRKANSSYSSIGSGSGGSLNSMSDLPVTIQMMQQKNGLPPQDEVMQTIPTFNIPVPQMPVMAGNSDLMADALFDDLSPNAPNMMNHQPSYGPMLGQPNIPEPPVLQLNSSEIDRLLKNNSNITSEEKKQFSAVDWNEYFKSYGESITDGMSGMEFIRLVPDSARVTTRENASSSKISRMSKEEDNVNSTSRKNTEYSAYYKTQDGMEVKKLVKELCDIVKNKTAYKKQVIREKLERLFDLRLSNGDTFLHMMLSSNQPSLEYIVKLIYSTRLTHLLNKTNNCAQSILHLAIIQDMPHLVNFLVSKGCNPMIEDHEGNNVIHYAVMCQSCLSPLLEAIKANMVDYDINAYNNEKQTALHLASIYGSEESASLLLANGASLRVRDSEGRNAIHLAAYDDCLPVMRALLDRAEPDDIDAVDGRGNTALQIVCGGAMRDNSIEIVKLLLEKNADPTKQEESNVAAWRMARDKPQLLAVLERHLPPHLRCEDDIKSEPEDEYESADDGDGESGLCSLNMYLDELSVVLDRSGAWRELAARLQRDSLLSWYAAAPSPTRTLLTNLRECNDDISSKSLALLLDDMGQKEASNIIRRYI